MMEDQSFSEFLRYYLSLVFKWLWFIFFAALIAGGTAFLISKRLTPIYQASTELLIDQAPDSRISEYTAILTSERLSRTYSQMVVTRNVLEEVIKQLDLDIAYKDLVESVEAEPVTDTQLILLQVENSDPYRAAQITNEIVNVFIDYNQDLQRARYAASIDNLEAQLQELQQEIQSTNDKLASLDNSSQHNEERDHLEANLTQSRQAYISLLGNYEEIRALAAQSTSEIVQLGAALPPEQPIRPRVLLNTTLATIFGLILATSAVLIREVLDDMVKTPEEISKTHGLPILGLVAKHSAGVTNPIAITQPLSPIVEAIRTLRTNIQFNGEGNLIATLLVTSESEGTGKTTLVSNLSVVMAQGDRRVILIDADLRRPMIHKILNLPNQRGLCEAITESNVNIEDLLNQTDVDGLSVLTSGGNLSNPSELLSSGKMYSLLDKLKNLADIIVIDSPPVLAVTDAMILSKIADATLLVIKPDHTRRLSLKRAIDQLQQVGANIIGVVLNDIQINRLSSYFSSGYYDFYRNNYRYGNGDVETNSIWQRLNRLRMRFGRDVSKTK